MRGTSYTGDIALDDFKVFDGPCNRAGNPLFLYCALISICWCRCVTRHMEYHLM